MTNISFPSEMLTVSATGSPQLSYVRISSPAPLCTYFSEVGLPLLLILICKVFWFLTASVRAPWLRSHQKTNDSNHAIHVLLFSFVMLMPAYSNTCRFLTHPCQLTIHYHVVSNSVLCSSSSKHSIIK